MVAVVVVVLVLVRSFGGGGGASMTSLCGGVILCGFAMVCTTIDEIP